MLRENLKKLLSQLVKESSKEELTWVNGYLTGVLGEVISAVSHGRSSANLAKNISIIYITDTGNSKFIAAEYSKKLKSSSSNVKVKAANQYRLNDLEKEENVIFVISTHGEGEFPDAGKKFYDHISSNELKLDKMKYTVIALGDKNYKLFCQAGKDVDKKLGELGAQSLLPRFDLDTDFENHLEDVYNKIFVAFGGGSEAESVAAPAQQAGVNKANYIGEIVTNTILNDIDSVKETRHIEITVEDDMFYEPGDSIGILLEDGDEILNGIIEVKEKVTPRLYSISSSVNECDREVHLTVALSKYTDEEGQQQNGLCSGYLAGLGVGSKVRIYVSKNRQFKLPEDNKDIIMVGPGTGIAPFRAFMMERNYRSSEGKNWLFFGECNFSSDFLYQTEWQDYLESGLLTKIDLAFSRDQKEKIYVQHRIKENAKELFSWLESGAYFYVCGDKERMAKDVENTLLQVIEQEGKKTKKQAQQYLDNLSENDRYLKDVY